MQEHGDETAEEEMAAAAAASEEVEEGPFAWSEPVQGVVLASYFYGYFFTQVRK